MVQSSSNRFVTETANATVSAADRARANHSGTQASTTISDFTEAVQDAASAMFRAGTNITFTYDDAANTFTINASGSGASTTDQEVVRDTIGGALVGGANIQITVNDAADTLTIAVTGLAAVATSGSASDLSAGTVPLARLGTGTPAAGKYLDGAAGAWTPLPTGGGSAAPRVHSPQAQNLKGFNFDPLFITSLNGAMQSGIMHWLRVPTPDSVSISNVIAALAVVGSGLTYAAVGIYNAAGTLLGQSADATATMTGTAGLMTIPLTAPVTAGGGGIADHIFVGLLAIGTTMPQLKLAASNDAVSVLAVMAGFTDGPRFGLVSAPSALPATVASPAAIGNPANKNFWVAVS